jgi:tRNA (mo5U34)-methyltransferase
VSSSSAQPGADALEKRPANDSKSAQTRNAISGEALSLIVDHLRRVNSGELDTTACARLIAAALTERDPLVELRSAPGPVGISSARDRFIGPDALARLNVLLPWTSFNCLEGDARVLGSAWSGTKRNQAQRLPDRLVENLNKLVPLRELSVLEAGCYEGHHTASLARFAREVWAFDGRMENVVKTLVRLWVLGLERSAVVQLIDIEGDPLKDQLALLGRTETFDLIHHRGVLYHLSRPIEHLIDLASICARHLYLHTQIAKPEQANSTYRSTLGDFDVFSYREPERSYAPFAGMTENAVWLTRDGLSRLLRDIGFAQLRVIEEREERHGLRIELIASR